MDVLDTQLARNKGQTLLAHDSYRLISYGVAGLAGSLGVGFLLGTAVNPLFGFGFTGIGLMLSAVGLLHSLRRRQGRVLRALNPDTALIRVLADSEDIPILVTSLGGDSVGSNEIFDKLPHEKHRPIASIISNDYGNTWVKAILAKMQYEIDHKEVVPAHMGGDYIVSIRRAGDYLVWSFALQTLNERLGRYLNRFDEGIINAANLMNAGIAFVSTQGELLYINQVLRGWHGLSESDPIPSKLLFNHKDTLLTVGDDEEIDVKVTRSPLPTAPLEEPLGEMIVIMRENPQTNLLDTDQIIDPLWDSAPLGVAVVDNKCRIVEQNAWFDLVDKVDIGKNILWLFESEDHGEIRRKISKIISGRGSGRPLDVTLQSDGAETSKHGAARLYFSSVHANNTQYAVVYLLDLSQQKTLEEQFVQAQKMQAVGQLAGGVAHDFNNLLTAIIGFSDLLQSRLDSSSQSFSDVTNIRQSANRAAALVRQMLAFSRQQTLRPRVLSVDEVMGDVTNLLNRLVGESITLDINYGRDLKPIKVDQGQLEQVFMNLVVNARDAMKGEGVISISAKNIDANDPELAKYDTVPPASYVLLEVRDDGEGIDPDNISKIFDPFFTTKDVGQGTGLGLSTVYGIIKQTDGHITVSSIKGVGTTFSIFLKAFEGVDDYDRSDDIEDKPVSDLTGNATILLVEDEAAVRLFTSRALTNKGHTVLEASSGEEGLDIFKTKSAEIDILISDVIMSGLDGPGLVREAKKIRAKLPVIFISGYAEDIVRKDLEDESSYFLPKPFNLNDLAQMVKQVLSSS